jgi:hypothetical protein
MTFTKEAAFMENQDQIYHKLQQHFDKETVGFPGIWGQS